MMAKSEGITIVGVEVKNFRRLEFAQLKISKAKGLVRVTGKNRAGKTSLLSALAAVLGGARYIDGDPINDNAGEEAESFVRALLSNGFVVERRFTPAAPKGYLRLRSGDGGTYNQSKLDEWLGRHAFDPLAFFSLKDADRTQLLLGLAKDPDLPKKLAELRVKRKGAYEERTEWIRQERAAKAVPAPEGDRPEAVDTSAEMERLQALRAEQAKRNDAAHLVKFSMDAVNRAGHSVADLRNKLKLAEQDFANAQSGLEQHQEALAALPDRSDAIAAVEAHIADANKVQLEMVPWLRFDDAQKQLAEAVDRHADLTEEIENIDAAVAGLLSDAAIPVPNLSFDLEQDAPLINGRPFHEASGAEKIDTAVAVALAAKPELRICLLDEANDLDLDMLEELESRAIEHGFQIWAVRIGIEGKGDVHIVDGKATETIEAGV